MSKSLLERFQRYTAQVLSLEKDSTEWMPFPKTIYQKIYSSLSNEEGIPYEVAGSVTDYDSLLESLQSVSKNLSQGTFWSAILKNNESQLSIVIAPFTESGDRAGDLFLIDADSSIDEELLAAFQQFPSLIIPMHLGGCISTGRFFMKGFTAWGGSILTYSNAIKYFCHEGSKLIDEKKGLLTYEPHNSCVLVEQRFLDMNNDFLPGSDGSPAGRKCLFGFLDKELIEVLGDKRILVVN